LRRAQLSGNSSGGRRQAGAATAQSPPPAAGGFHSSKIAETSRFARRTEPHGASIKLPYARIARHRVHPSLGVTMRSAKPGMRAVVELAGSRKAAKRRVDEFAATVNSAGVFE
jgi:hypothetical protein